MNEQLAISNEQLINNVNKKLLLIAHCSLLIILSCARDPANNAAAPYKREQGALPSAILQTGGHPIWFQLTERGIIHIESIQNAINSAAFIPWPQAVHIRFFYKKGNELVMAVNRDGFVKLVPAENEIALYHFSGGDFWKQYTIGGFFIYNNQDTVLLYHDTRFMESNAPLPDPRTWTFNMESNSPFAHAVPALEQFPVKDGWDADALRLGEDGYWYYRVSKRRAPQPEIQMIRTLNLSQAGISISAEDFFHSAPQEIIIDDPALPALPEGFVYTGTGLVGDSLFAAWEEQNEYNIGAAGFMLLKTQTTSGR